MLPTPRIQNCSPQFDMHGPDELERRGETDAGFSLTKPMGLGKLGKNRTRKSSLTLRNAPARCISWIRLKLRILGEGARDSLNPKGELPFPITWPWPPVAPQGVFEISLLVEG